LGLTFGTVSFFPRLVGFYVELMAVRTAKLDAHSVSLCDGRMVEGPDETKCHEVKSRLLL
jgi:hypothetical protein